MQQGKRGETVQDKDHCDRNAPWASVSNCSVLGNISCHDNGIFTEIDSHSGWTERKGHFLPGTDAPAGEQFTTCKTQITQAV